VSRWFGPQEVIRDVCLSVEAGEILCLEGPSGVGKTVLLEIMAGILGPDRGERVCEAERVGYAFQDDCLLPWRTARQNLLFGLSGTVDRVTAEARARHWLERVGLGEAGDKCPGAMSGGMRRRLNIARALAVEPDLVLLDEPFAFQDEATCAVLRDLILAVNAERGTAMVMVNHRPGHALELGARQVRIRSAPVVLSDESG
jgi:NitT/TauT family transport system ATP-binding protein